MPLQHGRFFLSFSPPYFAAVRTRSGGKPRGVCNCFASGNSNRHLCSLVKERPLVLSKQRSKQAFTDYHRENVWRFNIRIRCRLSSFCPKNRPVANHHVYRLIERKLFFQRSSPGFRGTFKQAYAVVLERLVPVHDQRADLVVERPT